jgi:site-specific recombinase XerD
MEMADTLNQTQPDLFTKLQIAVQEQQLSVRTESSYRHWITRFIFFYDQKNIMSLSIRNVTEFLWYLEQQLQLSRAKLNQVKSALQFLFEKVLHKPLKQISTPKAFLARSKK